MARYVKTWSDGSRVEKNKIKAIQSAMGILPDGLLGDHTLDRIYRAYASPVSAYSDLFYNAVVITGKPENIMTGRYKRLKHNSISGTFQWYGKTISPLVVDGKLINGTSAHAWFDKPDTVLYFDGEVKETRTMYFDEPCQWAIGGVGLHNLDPVAEGYGEYYKDGVPKGKYSDVHRYTGHTMIGVYPDGYMILVYAKGTGNDMRELMMDILGCKYAVMLDGGHIAAVNCDKAKFNINQVQDNIVYFKE